MKDVFVPHDASIQSTLASSILHQAQQGDRNAFSKIWALYGGLVYHWCRSAGLSPEDAEDVGQQVFLTVIRTLQSFRRDKPSDTFRGWLRVVARSRIVDFMREKAKQESAVGGTSFMEQVAAIPQSEVEPVEEHHFETVILYDRAMQLLRGEFAENDCKAFHMVVADGLSPRDVAEKLGVSVNSVYIAKSRILKRMRDEFNDLLALPSTPL